MQVIVIHHHIVKIINIGLRRVFVAERRKNQIIIIHHSTMEVIVKFNLLEDVIAEKKTRRRRSTVGGNRVPEEERIHLPMEIRVMTTVLIVVRDVDEIEEDGATDEFIATIQVQVLTDRRSNQLTAPARSIRNVG